MRPFIRSSTLRVTLSLAFGVLPLALTAQDTIRPAVIDLPLLELPYNSAHGVRAPGMQQSLGITAGLYEAMHTALAGVATSHPWARNAAITVFDYFTIAVPLGDAWLHEEWHRAVLGHNAIGSRNDVWNLKNLFAESISVSHVSDEDLVSLKKTNPHDFVRVKEAGYEGEGELITRLEKDQFFRDSKAWHVGLYWLIALGDALYVGAVVDPTDSAEIDRWTTKANLKETTINERDVSGHDFTAWVYHLFRPDEPFEARGPHPSGVGIDRYIKVADLSDEEKIFLKREGKLAWLNFVDPNFLSVRGFSFRNPINGGDARANFWLRHALTSFGHSIDANIVFQQGDVGIHLVAQRFTNHDRSFPGARLELVDMPVRVGGESIIVSPRIGAWSQPRNQEFRTRDGSLGGLAGLKLATPIGSRLEFYIDGEMKSAGWVAGRPDLTRSATFLTGIRYALSRGIQ
jgi:hypothetical protein